MSTLAHSTILGGRRGIDMRIAHFERIPCPLSLVETICIAR